MASLILEEKLEALRRCLDRIREKRAGQAEELFDDVDRQDILTLNITRAVQLCVDMAIHVLAESNEPVPGTMGESFDRLAHAGIVSVDLAARMKAAVGFRNIAVHNYQAIDWQIVHTITWQGVEDIRDFARVMKRVVDHQGD
jgi:uncharacterized protein YutE (UPF0331/DUF86 family)